MTDMTPPERLQDVTLAERLQRAAESGDSDRGTSELLAEAAAALLVRGEPVAWVRWSPTRGYAFRTVHTERDQVVNGDWRSVPLYATPPSEG